MALSRLGQRVRSYRHRERLAAIRQALHEELGGIGEQELRRAEAVIAYLHNTVAYTTLREENELTGEEIGEAIGWVTRTLVEDLRKRNHQTRRPT